MSHSAYESPYAPPQSSLETSGPPEPEQLATTGQRFLNTLLDQVALLLFSALVGGVLGFFGGVGEATGLVMGMAIGLGYFVVFEAVWGRTPAKLVTGTCVVSADGGHPRFAQILGRTAARMIPFEGFSFLGGRGRPVGWHDSLSGTRVVRVR